MNMSEQFSFLHTFGINTHFRCAGCGGNIMKDPITGRCGHSICQECHDTKVVPNFRKYAEWHPCIMPGCRIQESFEHEAKSSVSIIMAMNLMEELKWRTTKHIREVREKVVAESQQEMSALRQQNTAFSA